MSALYLDQTFTLRHASAPTFPTKVIKWFYVILFVVWWHWYKHVCSISASYSEINCSFVMWYNKKKKKISCLPTFVCLFVLVGKVTVPVVSARCASYKVGHSSVMWKWANMNVALSFEMWWDRPAGIRTAHWITYFEK